jgi:hypothetical protein
LESVRETCSCGAQFKIKTDKAMRSVREWRKHHNCLDKPTEPPEAREVAISAQVENAIGFRVEGLTVPAKDYDPFEDE